ncbi:trans-aconitate 2-methyltransferase [Planotetraspora phitsanulokensis]|uniref:Trans-aconitate 2-methyltransferase n=1 Tax=Planotetraspora phitsanulokensis TaxID=575192 RepID=A0A8J3XDY8_9ACTN|nr:trans-aconitate 2-methyltransferase [Planotetraspora phitsanulokensis]GII37144.1 trans-aconitate 2-methyltransferase [Planotetraspora phitsanulokensis]
MDHDIWDPAVYRAYADERSRPFFDLVARVGAERSGYVVDLGCGSGELTASLCRRWPAAQVHGVDSSPAMIEGAPPGPTFEVADVREWRPDRPVDVLVSNAVLQWVPGHLDLLERWVGDLAEGGWLAFQVPGNFGSPSHSIIRELCRTEWRDRLGDLVRGAPVAEPVEYLRRLATLGCAVDAWETTYVHVLQGEDAVLTWVRGTALRPILDRLSPEEREAFLAECGARLREAYPREPYGTAFPFRRIFVVAHK